MFKKILIEYLERQAKEREPVYEHKELIEETQDILSESSFSKAHIEALKKAYGGIKKINPDSEAYKKLITMLNGLPDNQLKTLAKSDVPFVSALARNRVISRGLKLESLNEASGYTINHKTFSSAVQHAIDVAEKRGFQVDDDDWDRKVAMGPRKPSSGKTNMYSIGLMKNGKDVKQKLNMQVYYDEGRYELNMYIQ
jgi:hypothetical protein